MLDVSIKKTVAALSLVSLVASGGVSAKVTPEEAARLGQDLTPVGAERAGNAAGTIPEWTGERIQPPEGHQPGDHNPDIFADDPILFTITAENVDQYKENLSEGQIEMFRVYPDTFKMNVYKTRRTMVLPDWVMERTKECATTAETTDDGVGIANAKACIPFPIPKTGHEVMWNHILRYQGIYKVSALNQAAPDSKGRYVKDKITINQYWPYWNVDKESDVFSYFLPRQLAPARVAGDTFLLIDYMNPAKQARNAWRYFGGQRRVRRAPVFVFDTPIPPSQGLRTVDVEDMWFGSLEKYDWELKGKKELYIGYNSYKIASPDLKDKDLVQAGHLNPDYPRYELHRVWVVEGKLKPGQRHIYPRRVLYIEEDGWEAHVHDMYDDKGKLWRTAHRYSQYMWHAQTTAQANEVHHDLISRRYNASAFLNEYDKTFDYSQPIPPLSFFTPASIRKLGVR